ncbi:MAG: GHKL domain-containing protein, partial [Clostridia bacterium]|nr:GHKL domain-containing protein [Clostridia bacterium]
SKILAKSEIEFTGENIVIDMYPADICADYNMIERAVYNYITNAMKHKAEDTDVVLRGYKEDDCYVFAVTNEGKEITPEEKDLIWDVFYKRDESRNRGAGGHGIGLAIVKRIAHLHSGSVDLISEDGKNTFYIKIKA